MKGKSLLIVGMAIILILFGISYTAHAVYQHNAPDSRTSISPGQTLPYGEFTFYFGNSCGLEFWRTEDFIPLPQRDENFEWEGMISGPDVGLVGSHTIYDGTDFRIEVEVDIGPNVCSEPIELVLYDYRY